MAGFAEPEIRLAQPPGWFDQLVALLTRELAPSPRKLRTALRMTTIATLGAGLVASAHVNNELGTYIVWLLVGAGPMMSLRKAVAFLIAEAFALSAAVLMAGILVESPWLFLPFIFAVISLTTYAGTTFKLGAPILLIQVVCLDTFYNVVFAPDQIGWAAAGIFGGSVIAFGTIVLFDNWLWPDPAEDLLLESLGTSVARSRARLLAATNFYLDRRGAPRPAMPPPTSDLPTHMNLLNEAAIEGVPEHRQAILLAAVTRMARIGLEIDRLTLAALQNVPREVRALVRPEIQATVDAIAVVLDEDSHELPTHIAVGPDQTPSASRTRARSALDALRARIMQVRPTYIVKASFAELENFGDFTDALAALTEHIERLLDEPPLPIAGAISASPRLTAPDPAIVRYSLKVGVCVVIGYVVGIVDHRPELNTILTTVIITALPTYGAALRKMNLRIIGAAIGGLISLLTIIIVTPNFSTLPAYLIAVFIVFYISAYSSLGSGRVSYAGKQIGTTFALVFTGLSPALDVYTPLWRIWAILLGTMVVAFVAFMLWPEYAGDSLLPRLRKVISDTLSLVPGGPAANSENEIQQAVSGTMRALAEILEVADDAQVEGRTSTVNHGAIVEAASNLRRIANRLAYIATGRLVTPVPPLDPTTESAREAVLDATRRHLQSWLEFFSGDDSLNAAAAQATERSNSTDDMKMPLEQFSSRLEEGKFARIESWTVTQRGAILAELHSMRRLEELVSDLNRWLAQIPGSSSNAVPPTVRRSTGLWQRTPPP
jgi:Fusaric acid resistance protein family